MLHGADHLVHEVGAFVDHLQAHVVGQGSLRFGQPLFQLTRDDVAVLTHEHEAETQYALALTVGGHGAPSDLVVDLHATEIAHADGSAVMSRHDDVADLLDGGGQAETVHEHRLAARDHLTAADVAVVGFESLEHAVKRQAVLDQQFRLHDHVELLLVSSPGVHLGHAPHLAQLGLHDPIMQLA